ncbi:hypothetical protein ElyMa_005011900 [Elysia marginata]|uniref:Uncharacterized protein n=1 Tax=Elysia marginata TaxID=1093978 RepID=A0AAV4JBA5_9GAST|nr:hypothetical protein ElyMa_005011900 [Elysia marginata]
MRTQEKSRWQVVELSVSLKIMWTVPLNRIQRIKKWEKMEQLIRLTNQGAAPVKKKNQKTLKPEWVKTSNLMMDRKTLKRLEDSMRTKNLKIHGKEKYNKMCSYGAPGHLSSLQKKKIKLCQRQFLTELSSTVKKECLFTDCKNQTVIGPTCISKMLDILWKFLRAKSTGNWHLHLMAILAVFGCQSVY